MEHGGEPLPGPLDVTFSFYRDGVGGGLYTPIDHCLALPGPSRREGCPG